MPFTISHVAAVIPAYRPLRRVQAFSAAVIGSMVPDFGMLLPGGLARWQTHSLPALWSFCLPIGLAAYCINQWLIKPAVLEVLPDGPYARLRSEHPSAFWPSLYHWLWITIALLLGALTHLVWDGFTHENARGVRFFPFLSDYGPEMAGHSLQLYRWLQYGSSVVGLAIVGAVLALWLYHARSARVPVPRRIGRRERWFWVSVYVALALVAVAWHVLRVGWVEHRSLTATGQVSWTAVMSLRGMAFSLLLTSLLVRVRLAARRLDAIGAVR